ncbi:hypothetical protein [Acaryochloris marina]|uniref:hypothetical protein n=1 Tax=Acaryochloris marina TaxID=155978 RepID=UPI001BB0B09A|nr:hypothetical protein [Acaryochloris marina]QUY45952.1 hypothetical protein I1H34_29925 [Acaryochloris marina S15]
MYKAIPLALLIATVPGIVQAQSQDFPTIEVAPKHGHTFYFNNEDAVVVEAWPGAFDAFDFGERPKIPSAKFIFVNLKPKGDIDNSTTLTVIYRVGGKEKTKTFLLKKTKGIPSRFSTAIDGSPSIKAAQPQPVQPVMATNVFSPPTRLDKQIKKEKKGKKPKKLKVSSEFSNAFSSGGVASKPVEESKPVKESKPAPEETEDSDGPDPVEPTSEDKAEEPPSEPLPLIRAPKTPQAKATIETPTEKQLIERSSLDNYGIANYLLQGLYQAERLKQINSSKPQFGQTHSLAKLLRGRRGKDQTVQEFVENALKESRLPPETFDNLLGHGGVGK